MKAIVTILLLLLSLIAQAQEATVVLRLTVESAAKAEAFLDHSDRVFSANERGEIVLRNIKPGDHSVAVFLEGYATKNLTFKPLEAESLSIDVSLEALNIELEALNVVDLSRSAGGMSRLKYIEVDGLYAAKKNEIVLPDEMPMNRASNNSRQLFAKVPGINIQETDAGGLQMGIGARGLDPKRTTNFNTRQNGYDISADALGYPESYYTPPIEAVEQIELVRGAASLQYGTQFGGLLNFRMKRGREDKPFELVQRSTLGSYGFFGSFTSVGGTAGGWNYYGYYQHKEGSGWRPNSHFNVNGFYTQVGRKLGENWSIDLELTHYHYNTKQPGGLTDIQFENDPSQSYRDRNWFRIDWNVASVIVNGRLTKTLSINSKTFVLSSERAALGFLGSINRVDTGGQRDLILGEFTNIGNETRLVQRFNIRENPGAILIGTRLYQGNTRNRQGLAPGFAGPDFNFINAQSLEGSDFRFPSQNVSGFAEVLLPLSDCWYLTPGVRFEHIQTRSDGYYQDESRHPLTNEILYSENVEASTSRTRNIALFGMGVAWRCRPDFEIYANASQNYRAMNFSDIYVSNPNLVIAPDLKDETGYTLDLGTKGKAMHDALSFEAGFFMMQYYNRIGESLARIENEQGAIRAVNYRSNIADARFIGVEIFEEFDLVHYWAPEQDWKLAWYNNLAIVEASYMASEVSAFDGNKVENVPQINYKTGVSIAKGAFGGGLQMNYISQQFTDATNAEYFPDATVGIIPAYHVLDLSMSYAWKMLKLEGSVNNLTDEIYFTRRATGYPGPGIIPAERRMFYMTLEVKF